MRNDWLKILWLTSLLALALTGELKAQFEEGTQDPTQIGVIAGNSAFPASNTVTMASNQGTPLIRNIVRFRINEMAMNGAAREYFKAGFTATVTLTVNAWYLSSENGNPDLSAATPPTPLTVTFDPTPGNQYSAVAYWVFSTATAQYQKVQVTVDSIHVSNISNSKWTKSNVDSLLVIESEMDVLRYFTNPTLSPPTYTAPYDSINHPDVLPVTPTFPTGTNSTQLEYAWVENETQAYYDLNGTFSTDRLFHINSTRVDIDTSGKTFNIPMLFDADSAKGGGTLYYRVRSVQRKNNGSTYFGPWSTPGTQHFKGHQQNVNWQSSTTFTENSKVQSFVQYVDGSNRVRQTVTKDYTTGNTTVGETIYDLQGRPNIQILPTPTLAQVIQFYGAGGYFNRFQGQATGSSPASIFDLAVAGTQCNLLPAAG